MATVKGWNQIPYSVKAQEVISKLEVGHPIVVRMKHVNSSKADLPKIQIEFAEKIDTGRPTSVLQMFNALDDRFSSGAPRAWETADAAIAQKMFGEIPEGEASVEILKPAPAGMRIQVTEVTEDQFTDNERMNLDTFLKRAGREGNFFYAPNGQRVGIRRDVVMGSPVHTYITGEFRSSETLQGVLGNAPSLMSELQKAAK